jgi:DNA-binding NtrC family response regulator
VRQLKNITEQISIIETKREINSSILQKYLPAQITDSRLPMLLGSKVEGSGRLFESEREILYQVLFDMRRDVTELKQLVNTLMAERGGEMPAYNYMNVPQTSSINISPMGGHNMVQPSAVDDDIQDTEEYVEETLALDEVEKEMIRKALERHHGRRKNAAKDLKISERTLYRKIKEYGLE